VGQSHGTALYALSRAADERSVVAERETKSISVEDTFEVDLVDPVLLAAIVDRHARTVCERLVKAKLSGRTVTLKARLHDFTTLTRSATLVGPTDRAALVSRLARNLLEDLDTSGGVRLLGVGVSGLADWVQEDLFADGGDEELVEPLPLSDSDDTRLQGRPRHGTGWMPGVDVEHEEYGAGWVWGAGLGRVTVRFETAETGPGPVRTLAADDPALVRRPVPGSADEDDADQADAAADGASAGVAPVSAPAGTAPCLPDGPERTAPTSTP
jgi:DNA polymerase-4